MKVPALLIAVLLASASALAGNTVSLALDAETARWCAEGGGCRLVTAAGWEIERKRAEASCSPAVVASRAR